VPLSLRQLLKSYKDKSPSIDQTPVELIKAGVGQFALRSINLLILIWNKEEFPEEWRESIIVPNYKKGDKTDCNNYRSISLLSSTYKILPNSLLLRLTPYA
jgi:hypothetical protein